MEGGLGDAGQFTGFGEGGSHVPGRSIWETDLGRGDALPES